jgi:adenosylhomocysteinase
MKSLPKHDVTDLKLADQGRLKIDWAGRQMPVLRQIQERFKKQKPLRGIRLAACLHVTAETANLMLALKAGGASLTLCASNPLSTQDDVAASLVKNYQISTFAIKGENNQIYYKHLNRALAFKPQLTMDDGADLVTLLHTKKRSLLKLVIGSSEETTTGVIRLRAMAKDGVLAVPVIAANDSQTKHLFDNRYGTGQSTIDGILRATNILLAGKTVVVVGYGYCGKGVAMRAKGMGAQVIVVEVDPVRALEAAMDGFAVEAMEMAAKMGDVFVTVTGGKHGINLNHMKKMKDGSILANAGHFDVEIDVRALKQQAGKGQLLRPFVRQFILGKKKLYLLADGRLVNLSAAEGHPAEVMDMSFANQALAAEFLVKNQGKLTSKVYVLPASVDQMVAKLKLKSMGKGLQKLTASQERYLNSWQEGT